MTVLTPMCDPRPSPATQRRDPVDPLLADLWHANDDEYLDGRLRHHLPAELLYDHMITPGAVGEFGIRTNGATFVYVDRRLVLGTHPDLPADAIPPAGLNRLIADVLCHEQLHVLCHLDGTPWDDHGSHGVAFEHHARKVNRIMGLPPPRPETLVNWPHLDRDPRHYLSQ